MTAHLDLLIVEDSETDAKLVVRKLRQSGFSPKWERVDSASALAEALLRRRWDLVISDSSLPSFNALEALEITKKAVPHVPFIVVSGTISEEIAVEAMRAGAADYVTKDNLRRLGPAVAREMLLLARRTQAQPSVPHPAPLEQPRKAREARSGHERLLGRTYRLLEAQEAERRNIARALHDHFGALLTAIRLNLDLAHQKRGPARSTALVEAVALVDQAIEQVRDVSLELWPTILDDLGLAPALRWLADKQARWSGLGFDLDVDAVGRLPRMLEAACFRVVQEALTNVTRHAVARKVEIRLRALPESVELLVHDDGKGFDVGAARERAAAGASLGLLGMQERVSLAGGRLEISSVPGQGSTVCALFPISHRMHESVD